MPRTLTARVALLAVLVALASSVLTDVVLTRTIVAGNRDRAAAVLSAQADTVAARLAAGRALADVALVRRLARAGAVVDLAPVGGTRAPRPPFTTADLAAVADQPATQRSVGGHTWLVVARPVEGRTGQGARVVMLASPVADATRLSAAQRRSALLAAVLGVLAGLAAGLLLARGVTGPLARAAAAARRLSAGERGVRVAAEGPREVADVSLALDGLADALATSEERQRQFLLAVSHELRTPLTVVTGYAEALVDGVVPLEEVPEAARVLRQEALRLQSRIEDLLALARLEAVDFRLVVAPVDLGAVLREAAAAWAPRARAAGVALEVEIPAAGPVIVTDGERVRQAVDALADNALRVLPPGCPLVLAAAAGTSGGARVEVRDGGPGLAPEDLAVAFERGVLAHRYEGARPVGSGLGLAMVGELARRLGGRAVAEHAPEGGACFVLLLPAAPPPPTPAG